MVNPQLFGIKQIPLSPSFMIMMEDGWQDKASLEQVGLLVAAELVETVSSIICSILETPRQTVKQLQIPIQIGPRQPNSNSTPQTTTEMTLHLSGIILVLDQ
jgi:hypothetical protein